ncbi:hypothetical protein [Fimbriiglobus ruber]|uniref:DUF2188 domain-containing protein n=1 Tax=Fimbriiglobus ruber TaxID=1908690 RepID=A0A225DAD3_9BACT|nr:hypothetical protein [Fimbriiglobus ruber]OWK34256.1 hypothetical protein FRUB_10227 [Fimbriiglobus ruber]
MRPKSAERWVVEGTDKHGEPFTCPGPDDRFPESLSPTKAQAEYVASRVNGRGGSVKVYREVWSGPAAAYRRE